MFDFSKDFLNKFDENLYDFLLKAKPIMPTRLAKFIALFYTDARVRKAYSDVIGVEMGEGTYANIGLSVIPLSKGKNVVIGKNVSIGPYVTFLCNCMANNSDELNEIPYVRDKLTKSSVIQVMDNVWIGANVTILPGITIGRCSVIGAGSVVTRNIEPFSIYAGVPARKIRDLETDLTISKDEDG